MLVAKTTIVGMDSYIDRLQKILYTQLKKSWNITDDDNYQCWPRCYRNKTETGFAAEVYIGGVNNSYDDVYYNEAIGASSFFGVTVSDKIDADTQEAVTIHLVFFTNLKRLYPNASERMDLQARIAVQKILETYGAARGFLLNSVSTGLDKCLAEYPKTRQDANLKYQADEQPGHCFRFDMQLINYTPTLTECGSD